MAERPARKRPAQIFISFSAKDLELARHYRRALADAGVHSVYFSGDAETGAEAGALWERELYNALKRCRLFLPLLSPDWVASTWCNVELRIARALGADIVPVEIMPCTDSLGELQHVLTPPFGDNCPAAVAALVHARLRRRAVPLLTGLIFPGIRPFDADRAAIFDGRDEEIDELHNLVMRASLERGAEQRALIVTGASGVGKSSLVRAGLVPNLEIGAEFLILGPIDAMQGLDGYGASLATAIEEALRISRSEVFDLINGDPAHLVARLAEVMRRANRRALLVVIDQAEELLSDVAPSPLIRVLQRLAEETSLAVVLLFAVRDDSAVRLQSIMGGRLWPLRAMTPKKLSVALQGPLEAVGVLDEEAVSLVETLLADAAGASDLLPLASFTMAQLETMDGGFTRANYERIGGLPGAIARAAERIWDEKVVPESLEAEIRRFFVPGMISIDPTGRVRLGGVPAASISSAIAPVVENLVGERLLHRIDTDSPLVEPAHEALFREWPRLRGWIEEEQARLELWGRATRDAAIWNDGGRRDHDLVHRGDRLLATANLFEDPDIQIRCDPVTRDYLAASLDAARAASELKETESAGKMQAVAQLAGGVSHDFNNIMTAVLGTCDLMLMRHKPGDSDYDDIQQIRSNANRASSLTRQLLAFSRQQAMRLQTVHLRDIVAELTHLLRRLIGQNIQLSIVHGDDVGTVRVDPGQLEQVVINIAVNARDAMPEGGLLTIETAARAAADARKASTILPEKNFSLLRISDTGSGIDGEILPKIFEPFFTTKEEGRGTGLGLSTVYGIVKQLGGYIFVESKVGAGTSVSIYLPEQEAAHEALHGPVAADRDGPVEPVESGRRIMIVEDEQMVRAVMERSLTRAGHAVIAASDGQEATELLASGVTVDLVISNIVMPNMDGPTFVRRLRERYPEMPVLFISGYGRETFEKLIDTDSNFLAKPFSVAQLADAVNAALTSRPQ